jgi:hypothetical protein
VGRFPVATIRVAYCQFLNSVRVDAICVDAEAIRIRPWHIECLDSACRAEQMFGGARVEAVSRERFLTREQLESASRHEQMSVARLRTNRAIAVRDGEPRRRFDLEPDAAAVTPTSMRNHLHPLPNTRVQRPQHSALKWALYRFTVTTSC